MRLINILPVHNEAWILGVSLRAMLRWADEVVVLLHACTDRSEEIAIEVARETGRVVILEESNTTWDEMNHRHRLLLTARGHGATHVSMFDADEVLSGNLLPEIRETIARLPPRYVLELPGYNLRGGINRYHANGTWGNRWFSAAFADDPRLGWTGDQFHHRHPMGPAVMRRFWQQGQGGIMHLWGASERRLIARHAKYKLVEALRWPNKSRAYLDYLYSLAIKGQPGEPPSGWRFTDVPAAWWDPYADLMRYLDLDAAPSQERECLDLIKEHGIDRFAGLDLFGVETCEQDHAVPA